MITSGTAPRPQTKNYKSKSGMMKKKEKQSRKMSGGGGRILFTITL